MALQVLKKGNITDYQVDKIRQMQFKDLDTKEVNTVVPYYAFHKIAYLFNVPTKLIKKTS